MGQYRTALNGDPNSPRVLNDLGWELATAADSSLRNGAEAVRLAKRACALTNYAGANYVGTLAAAYAEAGQYPDAVQMAEKARTLALDSGEMDLAEQTKNLLELYRADRPYHEVSTKN
jgi:hypothetical protein